MTEIIQFIQEHWGGLLAVTAMFVQVSPIKINPITILGNWLMKDFNACNKKEFKDLNGKIENLSQSVDLKINALSKTVQNNEVDRLRSEIFAFADRVQRGQNCTLNEYRAIIKINEKYHAILKETGGTNGVIDTEMNLIMISYNELRGNGELL